MIKKILFICGVLALTLSLTFTPAFAAISTQEPLVTDQQGYALPTYNATYFVEGGTEDGAVIYIGDEWLPTTEEMGAYYWNNAQNTYPYALYQSLTTTTLNAGINPVRATVQNGVVYYTQGTSSNDFYIGYRQFAYGENFTHLQTYISTGYLSALTSNANILVRVDTRYSTSATVTVQSFKVDGNKIVSENSVSTTIPADTFEFVDLSNMLASVDTELFQIRVNGVLYEGRCDIVYSGYPELPPSVDFIVRDESDIFHIENISYENFNLLSWLSTAVTGVFSARIFEIGGMDITLGTLVAVPISLFITIAFLKKFAGG